MNSPDITAAAALPQTNRDRMLAALTVQYTRLFTLPRYSLANMTTTPAKFAARVLKEAAEVPSIADFKNSVGLRAACTACGIEPKAKAFHVFVNS